MDFASIRLRTATRRDLEFLRSVHREAMRPHVERAKGAWDEDAQRERFYRKTKPETHEVIEWSGRPVGFRWVRPHPEALELVRIALVESARGQGIGAHLVRHLLADARASGRSVRLRVLRGNPARRLYERLGFELTRETETHDYMEAKPVADRSE